MREVIIQRPEINDKVTVIDYRTEATNKASAQGIITKIDYSITCKGIHLTATGLQGMGVDV